MARFQPAPDFDVEDFIEQLGYELAERYRDIEDELIREIAKRVYRDLELAQRLPDAPGGLGLTAAQRREQNRILAQLAINRSQAIRELQAQAVSLIEQLRRSGLADEIVRLAAQQGEAAAAASLGFGRPVAGGAVPLAPIAGLTSISGTYSQAAAMISINVQSRLGALNERITRYPQDAYQRIVATTTPGTVLGVRTSLRSQQQTVQRFLSEGITGFTDRSGRRWTVGAYSEMAGRTSVNRAFNDATVWRLGESGIRLGVITGGFDACPKCAPWIGRIVSLDGSPAGPRVLPHATDNRSVTVQVKGSLADARAAGWNHPNCRDRISAYSPGLSVPQSDFKYNEQADQERQQQRALERDVRAAKRDLATAPDDVARRRAERDIRDAQADLREFTNRTGRARQSYREQLGFSGS